MKTALMIAALMAGTAAFAQDTTTTTTTMTPDQGMSAPAPMTPPIAETPTTAPAEAMPPMTPNDAAPSTSMSTSTTTSTETYPVCSRTVTDRCMSTGAKTRMTTMHRRTTRK